MWKSMAQRSVKLKNAEAELVASGVEVVKESKCVAPILSNMGSKVELPIILGVDKVGAIFMTEKLSTSGRTKQIDVVTTTCE